MSQENVEIMRRLFAAAERRDVEATRPLVAEDLEIVPLRFAVDGTMFRGPEAIRDFFTAVDESWQDLTLEAEELREGGDTVVVTVRVRARGSASGASIDTRTGWVATFEEGRVKRWRHYSDPAEALAAAGLPE